VTPFNCPDILSHAACPEAPDYVKIDIDGYDGPILLAVLEAGYKPLVFTMEVQPEIPPPVKFTVQYHPRFINGGKTGFYGCSLSFVDEVAARYGYSLAFLDFVTPWTHDATYVRNDLFTHLPGFSPLDARQAFLDHPAGHSHLKEVGVKSDRWRRLHNPFSLLQEVWDGLAAANLAKHDGFMAPFSLYL
jgi:hypothetical protein